MKRFVLSLALLVGLGMGSPVRAGFVLGSTYHLDFVNFPDTFSADVTLDQTTKSLDNGKLLYSETIFPVNADTQWLQFNFSTPQGPLAGNANANWQVSVSELQLSQAANFTSAFSYWTVNGVPVSPINNYEGFANVSPNPVQPSQSPVYLNSGFKVNLGNPAAFTPLLVVNPYSSATSGGIPVATANDFHSGVQFTNSTPSVPEPSSILLGLMGFCGVAPMIWMRSRS